MFALRAWSVMLWVALVSGIYMGLRDHEYLATAIGLCVNLAIQYGLFRAIQQKKQVLVSTNSDPSYSEKTQKIKRVTLLGMTSISVALALSVTLLTSNTITERVWVFLVIGVGMIAAVILTRSFQRIQREHRS